MLDQLPAELILEIFSHFRPLDRGYYHGICRHIEQVIGDSLVIPWSQEGRSAILFPNKTRRAATRYLSVIHHLDDPDKDEGNYAYAEICPCPRDYCALSHTFATEDIEALLIKQHTRLGARYTGFNHYLALRDVLLGLNKKKGNIALSELRLLNVSSSKFYIPSLGVIPNWEGLLVLEVTGCGGTQLWPLVEYLQPYCTRLQELRLGWAQVLGDRVFPLRNELRPDRTLRPVAVQACGLKILELRDIWVHEGGFRKLTGFNRDTITSFSFHDVKLQHYTWDRIFNLMSEWRSLIHFKARGLRYLHDELRKGPGWSITNEFYSHRWNDFLAIRDFLCVLNQRRNQKRLPAYDINSDDSLGYRLAATLELSAPTPPLEDSAWPWPQNDTNFGSPTASDIDRVEDYIKSCDNITATMIEDRSCERSSDPGVRLYVGLPVGRRYHTWFDFSRTEDEAFRH